MWFEQMHPAWQSALAPQRELLDSLEARLADIPGLAPRKELVMAAFALSPAEIRVVILGQDPYPTDGVAVGRSFAVAGLPLPASLRNIFKELDSDIGSDFGDLGPSSDLAGWQRQGVFLLNRHLTTLIGNAGAHLREGWQAFTDAALLHLARTNPNLPGPVGQGVFLLNRHLTTLIGHAGAHLREGWQAFTDAALLHLARTNPNLALVLWGKEAASIKVLFDSAGVTPFCFESVHPSPLSAHRGFFGSRPFSAINAFLQEKGLKPIDWKA